MATTRHFSQSLCLGVVCWASLNLALTGQAMSAPDQASPAAAKETGESCASAVNQLAIDLLGLIPEGENGVLSPASVSSGMAMVYSGARGQTAEQIAAVLHFASPPQKIHEGFQIFRTQQHPAEPSPAPAEKRPLGVRAKDNKGYGLVVTQVIPGSVAAGAGVAPGDLILKIDDKIVRTQGEYADAIDKSGDVVQVQWYSFRIGAVETQAIRLRPAPPANGSLPAQFDMVNAVWMQQDFGVQPQYRELLQNGFAAHVGAADFVRQPAESAKAINAWIAEKTHGRIPSLLDASAVTDRSRLILTNVAYFRGDWVSPFTQTVTLDWHPLPGQKPPAQPVAGMSQTGVFGYVNTADFQMVELPYNRSSLSLAVLLPQPVLPWAQFRKKLTVAAIQDALAHVQPSRVLLKMPKFHIDKTISLEQHLREKMPLAFSEKADLGGICTRGGLKISAVRHQAFINVHEKGTEAGAASAIGLVPKMPHDVEFVADRPLVFLLLDRTCKAVLFVGQLAAPDAGT